MKKKTSKKKSAPNSIPPGEIEALRARLEEAEETLRAIRAGEVDALVVTRPEGEQVFTLKGADHSYQVLIEAMNEGAAVLMKDGTILYANRRFSEMLKVPLERLIGASIQPFVDPKDRMTFEALFRRAQEGRGKGEIALVREDKMTLPVYLSINSIELDNLDRLGLVATDLTEQKRNREVMAAEKLARSILEQAAEAIVVCDEMGQVIRASQAADRLCGENVLFKNFDAIFPLQLASREGRRVVDLKEGLVGEPKPFSISAVLKGEALAGVEARFRRKDGAFFDLLLNATALLNTQGTMIGCVVVLTDITDQKRSEESLRVKTLEAQEANRFKSQFVSNVSHELRTPLNAIIGYGDLLRDGIYGLLTKEQRGPLERVLRNAHDLLNLVNDLLDLSRMEFGKLSVHVEPVDASLLIREIVAGLQPLLNEKMLRVEWKIAENFPTLHTDRGRIKQIFVNLLTNAIKFTPKGKIVIAGRDLPPKKGVEITVRDTGIGIRPEELQKIFEIFHQVDGDLTRKFGGVGLGLAIVKELARLLQGAISVESNYGQGSAFILFLPYKFTGAETLRKELSFSKGGSDPASGRTA